MKRHALITGALGFVGKKLSHRLKESGWEITGVDRLNSQVKVDSDVILTACDISGAEDVDELFKRNTQVTHVFHLAAITFVPQSKRSPAQTMDVNLNGTINIIEAMKKHTPEARLIYVGSSEIYGPPVSLPVTENHPFNPQNPYAISKLAADLYCAYEANLGQDIVRMRPFNHSGGGQSPNFVLSDFCKQVIEIEAGMREPVITVGNLTSARDFSHVDDVVAAYELAALNGKKGAVYNVCSGESQSIADVLKQIIATAGVEATIEIDKNKYRAVDVPEVRGSSILLSDELNWKPKKSMTLIIEDLLRFWRKVVAEKA